MGAEVCVWGVPWSCGVALPVLTARARVGALAAGYNKIGPEGMRHLSEGLKANATVQSVTIEGTCTPQRARLVAELVGKAWVMVMVHVVGSGLGSG